MDPAESLGNKITVFSNKKLIGVFYADQSRPDVARTTGSRESCGFNFKFNKRLEEVHKLSFFAGENSDFFLLEKEFELPDISNLNEKIVSGKFVYFDVSDLIYFLGHHDNLTGIQRVQSCIILSVIRDNLHSINEIGFISYDNSKQEFIKLDTLYFSQLLEDLFLPVSNRALHFNRQEAKVGILPGSKKLVVYDGFDYVLCMLGAAWVNQDYFSRVLDLKRKYSFRFVMTVHDLIPIYASETCDQGTTKVFKSFFNKAYRYSDAFISVSENTAKDIRRYAAKINIKTPPIFVAQNGSHFNDFIDEESNVSSGSIKLRFDGEFVLFVSTIEGRKNHQLMFEVWQRLIREGINMPTLVCVGRNGWRAEEFLNNVISTNYLEGKISLLSDISDAELASLYEDCMFTVYPSLYEGWGLPVGESLSKGKICVTSHNSSIPEVAGEFGIYVDPYDSEDACEKIKKLVLDTPYRLNFENKIRKFYNPISWKTVAERTLKAAINTISVPSSDNYPLLRLGQEYSFANPPEIGEHRFGDSVVDDILQARTLPITKKIADNNIFSIGSELRGGLNWCAPEIWGVWSRLFKHEINFKILDSVENQYGHVFYLKLRANAPLIDSLLTYSVGNKVLFRKKIEFTESLVKFEADSNMLLEQQRKVGYVSVDCRIEVDESKLSEVKNLDSRFLGVGYMSFMLVSQEDFKTRINIIENCFLN